MKRILITGGAGFVGSNLAIGLKKEFSSCTVTAFDNLKRLGSEQNVSRLRSAGVDFVHGDVRVYNDIISAGEFDTLIECSAEPSVAAGYDSAPNYLIDTNLTGMVNCLEAARTRGANVIFLSSSRVYPKKALNGLKFSETKTRFELDNDQDVPGATSAGVSEEFGMSGARSLYGATKLCGELLLKEYMDAYGMKGIINRCGVISGPWQMGKVDQGFVALWAAKHLFGGELKYIGFGGSGKQVRDVLHIDDLLALIKLQLKSFGKLSGEIFNVGGGLKVSTSLLELTELCRKVTGKKIRITKEPRTKDYDIKLYVTDNRKITKMTGWAPKKNMEAVVTDICKWLGKNKERYRGII
jgi:CDP-paratose 2-epimerase